MINYFSDIDVLCDHPGCPPDICRPCCMKWKRAMKLRRGFDREGKVNWNVPTFPEPSTSTEPPDYPASDSFRVKASECAQRHNFINASTTNTLLFITVSPGEGSVLYTLTINQDCTWSLRLKNQIVPAHNAVLKNLPHVLNSGNVSLLFEVLAVSKCCTGNDDFQDLVMACRSMGQQELVGHEKSKVLANFHGNVIRSTDCQLLLPENDVHHRCTHCTDLRANLRARRANNKTRSKESACKTEPNSKVNYVHLTKEETVLRLKSVKKELAKKGKQLKALETKLNSEFDEKSLTVTDEQETFLNQVMQKNKDSVEGEWGVGSPQRLFWDEQIKR